MSVYNAKFAGSWYPGTESELRTLLDGYFKNVHLPTSLEKVKGVVAPHAGYAYSGQTAAFAFKALENVNFEVAIVLAPSHRAFLNKISTFNFSEITTPLGTLEVDQELGDALHASNPLFEDFPPSYMNEHSYELELPFLQYICQKKVKVLPLIVGDLSLEDFESAAKTLNKEIAGREFVVIASSDFTHYGENFSYVPFENNIDENLEKLDMEGIRLIEANNINGFKDYIARTGATICGKNPILLLMSILKKRGTLLNYTNSGMLTGDTSNSVSYASIAI